MADPRNIIQSVTFISDRQIAVTYKKHDEFTEVMQNTNPIIAAYTTAIARLKLGTILKKLGRRVLYFDTDSIKYVTDLDNPRHKMIETGDSLGELTNVLKEFGPNAYISEFVSLGPKTYAYKVKGTDNGKTAITVKAKGITVTNTTAKSVNFKAMRQMVHKFVKEGTIVENPVSQFRMQAERLNRRVISKFISKKFRVVYTKRKVNKSFYTYPFGF